MSDKKDQSPENKNESEETGPPGDAEITQEDFMEAFANVPANESDQQASEPDQTEGSSSEDQTDAPQDQPDLTEQLTAAEARIQQLQDDYMLVRADMDNLRKRTQREIKKAREFAIEGFAKDLLNVADNMDRALDAMRQAANKDDTTQSPAIEAMVEGVEMIQTVFDSTFRKHGMERLESLNQPFDPNHHQAMMQVEDAEAEPDTVVQELQPGYLLNGRLLRPAMVGVSKKA